MFFRCFLASIRSKKSRFLVVGPTSRSYITYIRVTNSYYGPGAHEKIYSTNCVTRTRNLARFYRIPRAFVVFSNLHDIPIRSLLGIERLKLYPCQGTACRRTTLSDGSFSSCLHARKIIHPLLSNIILLFQVVPSLDNRVSGGE